MERRMRKMENKQKRFQLLWRGSILYALFYTACLYHNASGITYPFFAGGTLLFWHYFTKKCAGTDSENSDADRQPNKTRLHKAFLMTGIVTAGLLNCTTTPGS